MIKLLNAGFTRLRKNKLFWLLTVFSFGLALFMIYTQYSDMKKFGRVIEVEQLMLNYSTIVGIAIAIFTSLFLGVEYSDGAIRNKISIGHKRTNIYLSNLIIVTITSLFSYILFLGTVSTIGIPLFGNTTIRFSTLIKLLGCIFAAIIAYASIFTFISMLISNKTISSIVNIMLAFGMIIYSLTFLNFLSMPEYVPEYIMENGQTITKEVKNPYYLTGLKRDVIQLSVDINPAGQMGQIVGGMASNLKLLPIYSLGIIVVFTGAGLVLFKKKELK